MGEKEPDTKPYRQTIQNIPAGHEQTQKAQTNTTNMTTNANSAKVMEETKNLTPNRIGKLLKISLPDMNKHTKTQNNMKQHAKNAKVMGEKKPDTKPYRQTIQNIPTPWAHGPHIQIYI